MPTVVNGFLWLNVYLSFVLCFVSQLLEGKKNTDQNFILLLSGHPWTSTAPPQIVSYFRLFLSPLRLLKLHFLWMLFLNLKSQQIFFKTYYFYIYNIINYILCVIYIYYIQKLCNNHVWDFCLLQGLHGGTFEKYYR